MSLREVKLNIRYSFLVELSVQSLSNTMNSNILLASNLTSKYARESWLVLAGEHQPKPSLRSAYNLWNESEMESGSEFNGNNMNFDKSYEFILINQHLRFCRWSL